MNNRHRFFNQDNNAPNIPVNILGLIAQNLDPTDQNNLALVNHEAHRGVQLARKRTILRGEVYFAVPKNPVPTSDSGFSEFYQHSITPTKSNILSSLKNSDTFLIFKTAAQAKNYVDIKSCRDIDNGINSTYEYPIFEITCQTSVDTVACNLKNEKIVVHSEVLKLDRNKMNNNFKISACYFEDNARHDLNKGCNIF